MKLAIFGVIAFVLGLGGSTGVLVLTAPAHSHLADSLAVAHFRSDSLARQTATTATAVTPTASVKVPVTVRMPADTATVRHPAAAGGVAATAAGTDGAQAPAVTRVPTATVAHELSLPGAPDAESFKQVGSILLNMKPVEAAKIVSYLNDDQVEGLLRSMTPRQAAGVLGQLPPERAAALSRRLLIPAKEVKP